jgi:four helix bundle protein
MAQQASRGAYNGLAGTKWMVRRFRFEVGDLKFEIMATIKRFEELEIWQMAKKVKRFTESELFAKDFRFKDQANASAGSVMDNIAEGFERGSRLEFVNFLSISKDSSGEVRSQLYRAIDYGYLKEELVLSLVKEYELLASKIAGFMSYLNKSSHKGQKFKERI